MAMMGRQVGEAQLFYIFSVDRHVPADHLLRRVDAVLDLSFIRTSLAEHYSHTGRPSIDPELMIRMLLVGYLYGIRSETRLCEEVHLNLAYRWFCRLGLDGDVPERSSFSKNRHGRFREGDLFRRLFEEVVRRCVTTGHRRGRRRKRRRGRCQLRAPAARRSASRDMVKSGGPGAARPRVLGCTGCRFRTGPRRAQAGYAN